MSKFVANPDDWDHHWSVHNEAAAANPAQKYRFLRIDSLINGLNLKKDVIKVVDLGCGSGDLLHDLSVRRPNYVLAGIEPSLHGVTVAASKTRGVEFINSDITKDAEANLVLSQSDVIVCTEVLEHLDEPELLLRSLADKVPRFSFLVLSVPGGPRSSFDRHIGHRRHFSKKRLENLLSDSGFTNIRVYRSGFPAFNIYKICVLMLGDRLIASSKEIAVSKWAGIASYFFERCMRYSLVDSFGGWQLFATCQKRNT